MFCRFTVSQDSGACCTVNHSPFRLVGISFHKIPEHVSLNSKSCLSFLDILFHKIPEPQNPESCENISVCCPFFIQTSGRLFHERKFTNRICIYSDDSCLCRFSY